MTKKETLVMDPIHGFINISEYPVIEELVESKYFQRLRRSAQLGMTSAVYPNATHTRFAHCLGVMQVFLILFDSITRREENGITDHKQKRMVGTVTALLHDLGHGPFSHASEDILDKKFGKFEHEKMTAEIISKTEITDILKKYSIEPQLVCDLLQHQVPREWRLISQLISSQLDADRLDYLVRDSYFTGVNYGKIDVHRIANTLQIWHGNEGDPFNDTAIVGSKGMAAIEDYILGRYLMYQGVYFHKLSRCMEFLLANVFKRAAQLPDSETHLSKVIDVNVKTTPEILYKMDDYNCTSLFHEWTEAKDPILKDLSIRILQRDKLASVTIPRKKYLKLGAVRLGKIPTIVENAGFPKDYYYFEDNYEKSAYDVYSHAKSEDEGYTYIGHIMTPDENGKLHEVSNHSKVINTLSDDEIKNIHIFFPIKVSQEVKEVVNS